MKWIGQLIYDQIAKFRKDVYLENISTGTIASGGNLGLDSNNKIVKAAEVGSSVDLTSEVTGTLPVGNGGTGVTSITDLKNLLDDETWTFANNITGTLATASQPNITSLGTLTVLGVDNVRLNDKSIEITGDTDDTFNITTGAAGATTLTTTDNAGTDGHFEVAADGNIILDAAGDIALECGGGDLTCDADTITFSSANADDPQFIIKNTTADNQGARLQLRKDRGAAMVDNDRIGEIDFFGEDASQNSQQYAKVVVQAVETDHGSETGKIQFQVAEFDGNVRTGLLITGKDADSRIDVDVASGTDSVTTIAGDLAVTTGLILDSVDVTAIQTSGESFADNDTSLMTSAAIDDKINTKYSTSYIVFSAKSTSSYGTNYVMIHASGISESTFSVDSGVDSAGDFGGVTTEEGGSGTDATASVATTNLEQQIPIPETCKLIGFYATTSTTTNTGAGYDTGVGIWHVPEANVNWGGSTAATATLIHKSDSSRHAENTAHGGTNRKKVQRVSRMDGTAKDLSAGDIIIPSIFGETSNQQIMATITLVIATPVKTI